MTEKSRSMPNDEIEKELFQNEFWAKNPVGHVLSSCDKSDGCFSTEKTIISPFNLGETWGKKQTKTLSKQNYVLKMILLTRRTKFCQVHRKSFEKNGQYFAECPKKMGEKHFWQKNISPQIVAMDRQKAVLTTPQTVFCQNARKKIGLVSKRYIIG